MGAVVVCLSVYMCVFVGWWVGALMMRRISNQDRRRLFLRGWVYSWWKVMQIKAAFKRPRWLIFLFLFFFSPSLLTLVQSFLQIRFWIHRFLKYLWAGGCCTWVTFLSIPSKVQTDKSIDKMQFKKKIKKLKTIGFQKSLVLVMAIGVFNILEKQERNF